MEPTERTFFHCGNNGPFRAFTIGSTQKCDAAVFFMNGASGLAMMSELESALMPGSRPSLTWLDYGRHDSPARRILHAARTQALEETWNEIEKAGLERDNGLWIVRGLIAAGMAEAGICCEIGLMRQLPTAPRSDADSLLPTEAVENLRRSRST